MNIYGMVLQLVKRIVMKYLLVLLGFGVILFANESLPSWYSNPPVDNEMTWYGVGEGPTLRSAKDSALADVASRLSVTVTSKVSKNATQTTTGEYISYNQKVNLNLESEVKKISFNNYDIVSSTQNESRALVLVQVDKSQFLKDQVQILNDTVADIKALEVAPKKTHILEEYKKFQEYSQDVEKAKTIISILTTFGVSFDRIQMMNTLNEYRNSMDDMRSKVEFYINYDGDSRNSADVLKEALTAEKIKISPRLNSNNSNLVVVYLDTELIKKQLFGSYMVGVKTTVSLKSNKGTTFSTFIVESKGNSSVDYQSALKNASYKFKNAIREQGIYTFLGMN
jgi:hypothetical protein